MKGTILDYNIQNSSGIISAQDGNRYEFSASQWKSTDKSPKKEEQVDFTIVDNMAHDIYAISNVENVNVISSTTTSVAAIISMVFGIIGMFTTWWFLAIPSIIAVITGHIARSNIKSSGGKMDGDGFALVGLILGYIIIFIYLIIILFFAGLIASAGHL